VEADSNYSIFHLANNEQVTVSKVLKEYEELLPEQQFVRVHKSSIVNLNYVKEYNSKNGLEVILNNGKKIAVSRRRSSEFLEKIKAFTQLKSDT
jgi:two-component system LytT family response regulator